jgi:hypothetical protein
MELLLQYNPLERQSRALAFVPAVHWLRRYLTEFSAWRGLALKCADGRSHSQRRFWARSDRGYLRNVGEAVNWPTLLGIATIVFE